MEVRIAFDLEKTRALSFQDEFPKVVKCIQSGCDGEARLAFVAHEINEKPILKGGLFVSQLYRNDPDGEGYWLHDSCAVAVYLCRKCLEPTALCNQA